MSERGHRCADCPASHRNRKTGGERRYVEAFGRPQGKYTSGRNIVSGYQICIDVCRLPPLCLVSHGKKTGNPVHTGVLLFASGESAQNVVDTHTAVFGQARETHVPGGIIPGYHFLHRVKICIDIVDMYTAVFRRRRETSLVGVIIPGYQILYPVNLHRYCSAVFGRTRETHRVRRDYTGLWYEVCRCGMNMHRYIQPVHGSASHRLDVGSREGLGHTLRLETVARRGHGSW